MGKRIKGNGVKAWSLSALGLYEKCPAAYKAEKLDKVSAPVVKSPAMERGIAIHAKGEQYLKGGIPQVPPEYKSFHSEMQNLLRRGANSERKVGLTKDWKETGFFAPDVWLRFVVDAELDTAPEQKFIVDFKTGRVYGSNEEQGQLYATAYMHNGYAEIHTEFWYLDQDYLVAHTYDNRSAPMYREYWEERVAPLFSDTTWRTTPSKQACKWCVVRDTCPDAEA